MTPFTLACSGSDLLGGFAGNDEIDGGSGADMIGGGTGSDNIRGGDGDDYISSSTNVIKSQQQWGKDDVWRSYGLPQGKEAVSPQALWRTYLDKKADGDEVTVWYGITETNTSRTDGDVIDARAGDDRVIASWGNDRIKGVERSITINSIALRAGSMSAKCLKGIKNRTKTSKTHCTHRKYKRNRPLAGIKPAQSATEYIETAANAQNTCEVQHG